MKTRISVVLALLWAALQMALSAGAHAAPLNLTNSYPDFFVTGLSYSYNAATGNLAIQGTVGSYSAAAAPSPQLQVTNHPTDGSYLELFSLNAQLDAGGNVLSGSFRIDGVVRTSGFPVGCTPGTYTCVLYDGSTSTGGLLSGNLEDFGWSLNSGSNGVLEFTFGGASGVIADLGYHGGGMILSVSSSTLTNFGTQALTTSWTGSGLGDVFVPVPAAVWLFGSGILALLGVARRKTGR
ncbi:MAG: hypothetical protein AB1560_01365 [Pseudomonadota bacterium]